MNRNANRNRVKGFTLIELVIVIAIIGILLGILMPSMINYFRSSRVKAANANAKMVYNAAQTEVLKYMSFDRAAEHASGFSGTMWIAYDPSGTVSYSNSPSTPGSLTVAPTTVTEITNDTDAMIVASNSVANTVNRSVSSASTFCWSVYVSNYIVQAAVAADNTNTSYVGHYSANKQSATLDDISGSYSSVFLTRLGTVSSRYMTNGSSAG